MARTSAATAADRSAAPGETKDKHKISLKQDLLTAFKESTNDAQTQTIDHPKDQPPFPRIAPIVDTVSPEVGKSAVSYYKHTSSTPFYTRTVSAPKQSFQRARFVESGASGCCHWQKVRHFVEQLDLPGISYDEFGVCIASCAPAWVRGRVARVVQIKVDDLMEGKPVTTTLDVQAELELEWKERQYLRQKVWDHLFKIDNRDPFTKQERTKIMRKLRGLGVSVAEDVCVVDKVVADVRNAGNESGACDSGVQKTVPVLQHAENNYVKDKQTEKEKTQQYWTLQQHPQYFPGPYMPSNHAYIGYTFAVPTLALAQYQHPSFYQQLTPPPLHLTQFKKRLCIYYARGYCAYGYSCSFLHPYPFMGASVYATAAPERLDSFQEPPKSSQPGLEVPKKKSKKLSGWAKHVAVRKAQEQARARCRAE
ncbi:hypothetical protein N0V90_004534 [Kalmusia sp. IMI 367209]|nr:hypothetical protein N0V90_004534 [Kalmusia sp. IMI 367209]